MGMAGLSQILRVKEKSAANGFEKKDTSVILLWLDGGPGHMDLYNLRPEAPAEYAGIWRPIHTNVLGFDIGELFPLQAKIADKFSIVRSLYHNSGGHFVGGHWMLTGRRGPGSANVSLSPSIGSMVTKALGARKSGMPAYVSVSVVSSIGLRPGYFGGHFLGHQHNPFETGADPNIANFKVQNIQLAKSLAVERLENRRALLQKFDTFRRDADRSGMIEAMDHFERQAFDFVTGPRARKAFDFSSEDPRIRDRYGRNSWGQSTLLARRLVEAGSTFVTCHFG